MADEPEIAAGDAMQALTESMIAAVHQHLTELGESMGEAGALAFVFGAISACSAYLAKAQGAAYCIEYLNDVAEPLRKFLTMHGGPGVGVGH